MKLLPINTDERIESIDIIRGIALFGIFFVNMPAFQWPQIVSDLYLIPVEWSRADEWIRLFFDLFVQAKFYTTFSFLFGLGFYIFMKRAEGKGFNIYLLFSRRLTVLAIFGFIHLVFLWYGDILLNYTLAGFFLLFFYKRTEKTIVVWAVILNVLFAIMYLSNFLVPAEVMEQTIVEAQEEGDGKIGEAISVYKNASFGEWLAYRWLNEIVPVLVNLPFMIPVVLQMFLMGLYAGKKRIFEEFSVHRLFVKRVWVITLVASLPFSAAIVLLHFGFWDLGMVSGLATQALVNIGGVWLSLFYISSLLFLLEKSVWRRLLKPLSYAGRMALTNYILQTIVGVGIYTGLGWFGEVNLLMGAVICLIVFPLQVAFSFFWLKKYRFGPLEWVWRNLTYGTKGQIRPTE